MSDSHRVLLYNPRANFHTLPLGLLAIGSALDPERFEVRIVDGRLEADPLTTLAALVDHRTLCLRMGVLAGAPLADALAVSREIRARFPELPILWGGWHASLFGEACLEEPSVDMTVRGQGERTFAEILERLIAQASPLGVAGCSWRDAEGSVHREAERPPASVEDLPAHDYRLLPVTRYFAHKGRRHLDYVASQGCFWRCAFCADPRVFGRTWSGLSPGRMLHEISGLWREHRFSDLNRSLEDWSRFDIYTLGSWLDPGLAQRIQRFDHYQRRGWDAVSSSWRRPLAALARWRCEREAFALPWEMWLSRSRNS